MNRSTAVVNSCVHIYHDYCTAVVHTRSPESCVINIKASCMVFMRLIAESRVQYTVRTVYARARRTAVGTVARLVGWWVLGVG